jgi:hypothetical protein
MFNEVMNRDEGLDSQITTVTGILEHTRKTRLASLREDSRTSDFLAESEIELLQSVAPFIDDFIVSISMLK